MCGWLHLSGSQGTVVMAFSVRPTSSGAHALATRMSYDGPQVAAPVTLSTLLGMLRLPFALNSSLPKPNLPQSPGPTLSRN